MHHRRDERVRGRERSQDARLLMNADAGSTLILMERSRDTVEGEKRERPSVRRGRLYKQKTGTYLFP